MWGFFFASAKKWLTRKEDRSPFTADDELLHAKESPPLA